MTWDALRSWLSRYGRWILFVLGIGALVVLVRGVGLARVLAVLTEAGRLMPLILVLDLSWVVFEGVALLLLLGDDARQLPPRVWLQGTLAHYVTMTVLPVGRAGAEVLRAAIFGPHVGKPQAMSGAALIESGTLFGNTLISLLCGGVAFHHGASTLGWLLMGNGAVTLVLSLLFYLGLSKARAITGIKLLARFSALGDDIRQAFDRSRSRHLSALGIVTMARLIQTLQYGVIVFAVSGVFSLDRMFIAQGIHLIGAGLGDMVPNQVGITEGAYRLFADALGYQNAPERAVAVALLARLSNVGVAGICALFLQVLPRHREAATPGSVG